MDGIEERGITADGIDSWVPDPEKDSVATARWYFYDPEALKYIYLDMLDEAGADLRINSLAVDVAVTDGKITSVEVENLLGRESFSAHVYIDTTGSADIAARAGAPTDYGRKSDGAILPSSTSWRIGSVDMARLDVDEALRVYTEKRQSGELDVPLEGFTIQPVCDGIVHLFGTRVFGVNPLDAAQSAYGEREQRRQIRDILLMLKKYVPAFKNARLISTGVAMGQIGTRRIQGEYHITMDDLLKGRKFDDVIATGTYRLEIWDPTGQNNDYHHITDDWYSFPYRCLLPRGLNNIIAAGSCISGQYEGMAAWAIQPVCMLTGQAAGTAAGLCVQDDTLPREISVDKLQQTLKDNGVFLG